MQDSCVHCLHQKACWPTNITQPTLGPVADCLLLADLLQDLAGLPDEVSPDCPRCSAKQAVHPQYIRQTTLGFYPKIAELVRLRCLKCEAALARDATTEESVTKVFTPEVIPEVSI